MLVGQCLKRFPSVVFPRYYASAAAARASKPAASDTAPAGLKKRARRKKKEEEEEDSPEPLLPTRPNIQAHLDSLAESSGQLDLADIERYRPSRCPPTDNPYTGIKTYQEEYNNLKEKIAGSFNVRQLRLFLKLYGVPVPWHTKKDDCAVAIMEGPWNWPSLAPLLEKERDASDSASETKLIQQFPLNPSEAFLLLGKDGMALRSMGIRFRLQMKYVQSPQALVVEGKLGALKQFRTHVGKLKAAIVEDVFELPENKPIGSHLFQRISRLSGAYITSFGESRVRVSFDKNHPRTALVAKRLVASAVCEENNSSQTRVFFHVPPTPPGSSVIFPHDYALYPFLSPRSLSLTVSASGVFRMRRVENWLSDSVSENPTKTGGLFKGRGRIVSLQLKETDLRKSLLVGISPPPSNSSRVVNRVLQTSIAQPAPLQGHWKLPYVAEWMEKRSELTRFAPTAEDGVDTAQKIVKVELVLPRTVDESLASSSVDTSVLERPTCSVGRRVDMDIMMPDRPADIRFSVLDSTNLAVGEWPALLEQYLSALRALFTPSQPEAPLSFVYEDVTYVLQSNSSVRQSIERTNTADSIGNHKSASCEIICGDAESKESWESFLQHCDWMSTVSAAPARPATPIMDVV
ncbi:hypothetical protein C8R46DRAFT_1090737 [Mycena filopes]|nr:hypothetical protein C8R46DRAFT_1090737 [Mycena filopes]